ncbi:MAG: undecaprenyldiphospho-muramoylpentapeptide beta-N-acetylglucosaminyltransferase [Beggiatoa sp. IS2]|nr:MAG: undecaprenyldiphospho-muramoylpentapeptide beta-N-acetylglucosaminyltransferase [Beggiatoa sp. IS2]
MMAGGTGGHVFPALAIAEALRERGISVGWLGTQQGLESQVVPQAGIDIHYIQISGVRGKNFLSLLRAPFKVTLAIWQAIQILRKQRPAAVVGMGGFVTGPGGIAAWLLRIPLIIHEQNAIAGLTNRWLARFAHQVLEAFPNTFAARYRAIHTGNPLRANIMALTSPIPRPIHDPLRILVVGGSLGAKILNETVPKAVLQIQSDVEIWHQTGRQHFETLHAAYPTVKARVVPFIEDMAAAYSWADVVICRAGALTVSELAQASVASILVPYIYAVDDHQTRNAEFLASNGAAFLLPQKELTPEKLATLLDDFIHNPMRLQAMSVAAHHCATPTTLSQIVDLCVKIAYGTTNHLNNSASIPHEHH